LASVYANLGQRTRAAEYVRSAYERRHKVSERERVLIESRYYKDVTGELEKAAETYELWRQLYPRDMAPGVNLGSVAAALGNWEKALVNYRDAHRVRPEVAVIVANLAVAYNALNRFDEENALLKQADARTLRSEFLQVAKYQSAFLRGDAVSMGELVSNATGDAGSEPLLLAAQADTHRWYGQFA